MLEKELSFADLPVPLSEIYEAMGYADAVPDEAVEKEVRGVLERVEAVTSPRFCFFISGGELDEYIRDRGWRHTNRFSPGYCGWHVSEQKKLFPLFPSAEPCGIRLTDSSLMLPIKSVSGVIGLGDGVRKLEYTCGLCTYDKCYRRKRRG